MTDKTFPPSQQRLMTFVRRVFHPGFNHYNVSKLIGDASARQYYRYVTDAQESFILAVYPESFQEDAFTYAQIYDLLRDIEIPVPEILRMDGALGIVLQQDLGNTTLQKRLMTAEEDERGQYLQRAVDYIVRIQSNGTSLLKPEWPAFQLAFDEEKLVWELNFFHRHYVGNYRGRNREPEAEIAAEFSAIASELARAPRFLCHRDYHIRNLMLSGDLLYVIDFQDARWGPASYDLVSLLKDSIELEQQEVDELTDYYLARAPVSASPDSFRREFQLMTVQRLLKALGTYGYQVVVRENFIYEQYMAGSLHRTLLALQQLGEFPGLRAMVEQELSR